MKTVQIGRSRLAEEMARPTWSAKPAVSIVPMLEKKKRTVERINANPISKEKIRVAAYCRVSSDLPSQETSIDNQREHYENYIKAHEDWEFAGIYWETGVSGTKTEKRPELQRLIADCQAGNIDLVITKSISRFARNTTDCLEMVRTLTSMNIRLIFEKEKIDTKTMESEFLLTLLSAFAENESRSLSDNLKWGIRKRFQAGTYKGGKVPYGYRRSKTGYIIYPAEAETVRRIFSALEEGKGTAVIAKELNEDHIPTWTESFKGLEPKGSWRSNSIIAVARNAFYTGDSLYQKTFMDEHFNKQTNTGQLDQYLNEDDHPAIVDHELFKRANEMIDEHGRIYAREKATGEGQKRYWLSGKLRCGICGGRMFRGKDARPYYVCWNHTHKDCPMLPVFEDDVKDAFVKALNRLAKQPGLLEKADPPMAESEERLANIESRKSQTRDQMLAGRFSAALREEMNALDAEAEQIRSKLEQNQNPANDLKKLILRRGQQEFFTETDETIFRWFVDHADVWSRERIIFHFTCGLELEEILTRKRKQRCVNTDEQKKGATA